MLRKLAVRHFQSLHQVDLTLDGFTVIVGPSGSGKSALVRAIKLLVSNARGFSYVSKGEKKTQVVAVDEDATVFSIERGDGHGVYELIHDGKKKRFTKLGGAVPDEASETLKLDSTLTFAGQFDRPYLLDDSGQQVARALGELTNVTTIFEAVREANRRRLAQASKLKTRKSDHAAALDELQKYRQLPIKLKALTRAEELLEQARDVESKLTLASRAIETMDIAQRVLREPVPRPTPSLQPIEDVSNRIHRLRSFQSTADHARAVAEDRQERIAEHAQREAELHEQLHEVLVEAGVCPTCGQITNELERV